MVQNRSAPPVDLPAERRRIRIRGALALMLCALVLGLGIYWLPRWLSFPVDLADRLAFALRADLFVLIWLLIAVGIVSTIRRYSAEDNAGSAFSPQAHGWLSRPPFSRTRSSRSLSPHWLFWPWPRSRERRRWPIPSRRCRCSHSVGSRFCAATPEAPAPEPLAW